MNANSLIFQQYLNNDIQEPQLVQRLDEIQSKNIKQGGVVYTPWSVVQAMIELANPRLDWRILEPSCGHGVFLLGLLEHMRHTHGLSGKSLLNWFLTQVTAIEISKDTVEDLHAILNAYFLKHDGIVLNSSWVNIRCQDSLLFQSEKPFDLGIGNPPYVRAKHLDVQYLQFLKHTFSSCQKGTVDLYFAFIEKYLNACQTLVFITPNSFLNSKAGASLKRMVFSSLHTLIDFKEHKVFENTGVYTCIFKTVQQHDQALIKYGNTLKDLQEIPKNSLLESTSTLKTLGLNPVLSGLATLCDGAFRVEKTESGIYMATHEGQQYPIEEAILAPYLKLTKLRSNDDLSTIGYMIVPYDLQNKIYPEEVMQSQFPLTYHYLNQVRPLLMARDKGKNSHYEAWYAFGRKQGLNPLCSPDVVVIPQMIGGQCLPYRLDLSSLLHKFQRIVFTSGFLVPATPNNASAFPALLGPEFLMHAAKHGRAWPGKSSAYYSLNMGSIKSFESLQKKN